MGGEKKENMNSFCSNADYDIVAASENDGEEAGAEWLFLCEEFALDGMVLFLHFFFLVGG